MQLYRSSQRPDRQSGYRQVYLEKMNVCQEKKGGGGGGAFRRVVTAPASWDDRGSESGDGDESR